MRRQCNRGSALVLVILFLLIISGIVTNITVLNYIEILRQRKTSNIDKAKQNAIFGLNLAIENLQTLSGSDTSITAPCKNFDYNKNLKNGGCVSVWIPKSENEISTLNFVGNLTSDKSLENITLTSNKSKNKVKIFSSPELNVFISPKRIFSKGKIKGQYGFFTFDESQKIKINLVDRYSQSNSSIAKRVRQLCPQRFGYRNFFEPHEPANDFILTKIDFPEQLEFIDEEIFDSFLKNKNHLTLHSYGILSNPKTGGLQNDLCQLKSKFDPSRRIFEPKTILPSYIPTFGLLFSFFESTSKNATTAVSATYPMFRPQVFKNYFSDNDPDLQTPVSHGIYPILVQSNVNIGIIDINGKFSLTFIPQILVWNPYTVELKHKEYILELCVPITNVNYRPSLTLEGFNEFQQSFSKIGTYVLSDNANESDVSTIFRLRFSSDFKPGERKVFSLQTSQAVDREIGNFLIYSNNRSQYLFFDTNVSTQGFSKIRMRCTDSIGKINSQWNCFYWRLSDASDGKILQEIAELDPVTSESLECERNIVTQNANCFSFVSRMKFGISEDATGNFGIRWLANSNPRAPYINRAVCQGYSSIFFSQDVISGNWSWQSQIINSDQISSINNALENYINNLILFDIPDSECGVLNIGYLRHVNFLPFGYFPSQIFGSSRANPMIPASKIFQDNAGMSTMWSSHARVESLYDYSYLLNESIFDQYFVSTKPDNVGFENDLSCFINKRFRLSHPPSQHEREINSVTSETIAKLSEVLMVDGAFNVNSLNPLTWESVLTSIITDDGKFIFPRFFSDNTKVFTGFYSNQIKNLATILTDKISERTQPFGSLSEFVNRKIDKDAQKCTRSGILQEAIDSSGINSENELNYINSEKNLKIYDDISASGYLEENLPMALSQADILQSTSHFLCARGDTFLIRAFGDHVDENGNIIERAYCEAIVQRTTEFLNSEDNHPSDTMDNLSKVNRKFGRRYKIILFRWLNENQL